MVRISSSSRTRRLRRIVLGAAVGLVPVASPALRAEDNGAWGVVGAPAQPALARREADGTRMDAAALRSFRAAIDAVTSMPSNGGLRARADRHGLDVLHVLWEDTGRSAGSAVGPNISDVTLQVREPVGDGFRTHLLPVIRLPNFTDETADIAADKLWIKVGNQSKSSQTVTVPLTEVLANLREYVSEPESVLGSGNLLVPRDTHFLVSAQHVFVPIPKAGKAEFNPVLFNYQSSRGNPAVLTLLCTREGTSVAVIENSGGEQSFQGSGQQLFFNNKGQRTVFTAERKSDVKARIDAGQATAGDAGALDDGADMLLIVQVPLKHRARERQDSAMEIGGLAQAMGAAPPSTALAKRSRGGGSDVEQAVLGHGEDLGPVVEGNKLALERDDRFPVRVTVQFYKATSNGLVSDDDLADVKQMIDKVYAAGDFVGSLVVPEAARHRPTDWILGKTRRAVAATPSLSAPPPVEPAPPAGPAPADPTPPPEPADATVWDRFKAWLRGSTPRTEQR